jgi:HEAT repeat protein
VNSSSGSILKKPFFDNIFSLRGFLSLFIFGVAILVVSLSYAELANKKILKKAWSVVRESLTNEDSQIREMVVQGLEYIDDPQTINALKSSLEDQSEYVQIWSARSLAKKGDFSGKNTLLSIVKSQPSKSSTATGPLAALARMQALARGRVRGEAATILGLFTNDPEVKTVLKGLKVDSDGRVRDGAAVALSLLGDKSEAVVFASALKDEDKGIRLAAAEALAAIKSPATESALLGVLFDPDEGVRSASARALGGIKSTEAVASLKKLTEDPSGKGKESAVWALGEIGSPQAESSLRSALNDPNIYVTITAAEALGKIGNNSGLGVLEGALNSNDIDARTKAASALYAISDRKTEALASKTLDDGNVKVRLGAALSLFRLDQKKSADK